METRSKTSFEDIDPISKAYYLATIGSVKFRSGFADLGGAKDLVATVLAQKNGYRDTNYVAI